MTEISESVKSVAVVGAAGYVGQHLCVQLQKRGYQVTGVCRPYAGFLLRRLGIDVLDTTAVDGYRRFGRVVNLAFPTRGLEHSRHRQNREIGSLVDKVLAPGGRLVHTSTLAVFGFELDTPPALGPVAMRADYEYCVSKIAMEHAVARHRAHANVHIVRLGNVWGPGSPNWTAGLLQRLRAGLPVLVRARTGWSNATEVRNVCDYIGFLLDKPESTGLHFHHLAEFGHVPWSDFVNFLSTEMSLEPVTVDALPTVNTGRTADLRRALNHLSIRGAVHEIMRSRHLAADMRAAIARIPSGIFAHLKQVKDADQAFSVGSSLTEEDQKFCAIIGCDARFPSATDSEWCAPVSLEQSFADVRNWMRQVAYV